jgi:hypothetical protein
MPMPVTRQPTRTAPGEVAFDMSEGKLRRRPRSSTPRPGRSGAGASASVSTSPSASTPWICPWLLRRLLWLPRLSAGQKLRGRDLSSLPGAPLDLDQEPRPAPIVFFMSSSSRALCAAERDCFDRSACVSRLQNASRSSWRQPPPQRSKVELGQVRSGENAGIT